MYFLRSTRQQHLGLSQTGTAMWRLLQLRVLVVVSCAVFVLSSCAAAAEESAGSSVAVSEGGVPSGGVSSHQHDIAAASLMDEDDSDWSYLRRFYEPPEKRAYSYVSEFKRLPVYNFGLGKRAGGNDGRLYAFGLGKRVRGGKLGKRPSNSLYSFGLGKRSMDYSDDSDEDEMEEPIETLDEIEDDDDEISEDKRAGARQYSFGLGKRYPQRGAYSFGLGKRAQMYSFGLGKRAPRYSFGLGKRLPSNRQYSFGLGKREISSSELAAVAAEALAESSTQTPHQQRRSVGTSGEQSEWADAETPRHGGQQQREDENFGRAGRRTYSFGLGKRLPALYSFGVGKRQPSESNRR